jgi:hypothetical protein
MKFHKTLYVVGLLILVSGLTLATNAQRRGNVQERWQLLGQSNVDGARDHDNIRVNSRETFRAIQLRVQGGEIDFQRVVVHFENGADTEVEIRDRIRAGGQTRAIDLPGDNRRIESVEVWYGQGNWGRRRPTLRLYGLVSAGGRGRDRDDRDLNRPVQTVYCESGDMKRHWCSEGIGRTVRLLRQRSQVRCVQGRTWGVDRSGIWVDRGCRADFEVR